jgi:hypothetical protein
MRICRLRSVGVIAVQHFVFVASLAVIAGAAETVAAAKCNYERPFEPPTRSALIPLPPGAVEPEGWLRDWCIAAKDGYTATMNQRDPAFRQAWAKDYRMTGDHLSLWDLGGWPYEGGGYWFDGLAKLGFVLHDKALIDQAKSRLDVVVDNMTPDSILFMWWLDKNKPEDMNAVYGKGKREEEWPIWANGLMGRSLVGYYAGSRDPRVLKALETAYSSNRDWVRLGWSMIHPWPALETYTWTGNQEIKESLTALFSKEGDDKKPGSWNHYRRPPNDKPGAEPADHGVHFCESTAPWALGYLWTGKREFLDAALRWHDKIERECMQPYGVPVFDEYYGPTGAFRGTETCDVAAYMWSQNLLLTISGQGRLADRIERAFFNAGPATVSRDFKTHVYMQSPNRMADHRLPAAEPFTYKTKHDPLCCTAAANRILPNYVINMWMATRDNGLAATCYGPCKVSALVADRVPVEIVCRTDYPFNEPIEITVKPQREATFPLSFRIPGWCKWPTLDVNEKWVRTWPVSNGFVRVNRAWKPNDKIDIRLSMFPEITKGRDANTAGAPYGSVSLGPLLFALPIADTKNANTPDTKARWKFALDAQAATPCTDMDIFVERRPMPGRWNWPLESPLTLRVRAASIDWNPTLENLLPSKPFDGGKPPLWMTLVPYGCTKFRVSMLPVTKWAFETIDPPKDTDGWGPERGGLRTRLLPMQKEYVVGRMARFRLEMKNFGKSNGWYYPDARDVDGLTHVTDPAGKPLRHVGSTFGSGGSGTPIRPGKTVELSDGFDLTDQFLLIEPGSYTVQYRGTEAKGDTNTGVPPSGKITIEMRPGIVTTSMKVSARLVAILPKGWDLSLADRDSKVWNGRIAPPGWESGPGTYVALENDTVLEPSENVQIWVAEDRLAWTGTQRSSAVSPFASEKTVELDDAAAYLGKGSDGYVYWILPKEAEKAWPGIRARVKGALKVEDKSPAGR